MMRGQFVYKALQSLHGKEFTPDTLMEAIEGHNVIQMEDYDAGYIAALEDVKRLLYEYKKSNSTV
jgi:hypothetical protein